MLKTLHRGAIAWLFLLPLTALAMRFRDAAFLPQLGDYHAEIAGAVNAVVDRFIAAFQWLFAAVATGLEWPLTALQWALHSLPWSFTAAVFTAVAFVAGGRRLAVFTAVALCYIAVSGYWREGMNTLALVGVSVPLAVALGFVFGVIGYRSNRAARIIQPCLDLMQTVPTFAYLIPILLLFGFGPVVGLIAGIIYACPPMVRNTMHGLRRVDPAIREAAVMCGATRRQLFWRAEVPAAAPQLLIGINQTTMAALAMVIIAAIIGGFDDIGWEVLSTMRKAQFGQSLLSGIVIVLLAMLIDRISAGFAERARRPDASPPPWRAMLLSLFAVAIAAAIVPALHAYPPDWRIHPAAQINAALAALVANFGAQLEQIKVVATFYFLLPIKLGFIGAVRPVTWGFDFTPALQFAYWLVCAATPLWLWRRFDWRAAVALLLTAAVFFYGFANIPWPVFLAVVALIAYQAGGASTALFAAFAVLFIRITGVWQPAMLSVYLCAAAVLVAAVFGGAIGIAAALNDRVSACIRPINDTLQTMPQFVYLIPVLFLFQIGDFSALIAVVAYCIVPMIRYTEHGIRNIAPDIIEAARAVGCTRRQILFEVQLPVALPEILLGVNQTIMFGLAMLVIAALVGTRGLGQSVYIALGQADAGGGLIAGVAIALIAMVADRIIQAWAGKRQHRRHS